MFHSAILQCCLMTGCFVFHEHCNVKASSRNVSFIAMFLGHSFLIESSRQEMCAVAFTFQSFIKVYVQTMLEKSNQTKCI